MMRRRTLIALAVLVGGVVFAVIRLWPGSGAVKEVLPPSTQAAIDDAQARLEQSSSELGAQIERSDPSRFAGVTDRIALRDALRDSLRKAAGVSGDGRLSAVVSDRLSLYAFPDFDAYADHVAELTGLNVRDLQAQREVFEKNSPTYARATFLWDQVEVREHVRDQMERLLTYGMSGTSMVAEQLYGKAPEKAEELARCRDVVVPLLMPRKTGEAVAMRLVISMRPGGPAGWMPFLAVIYDPQAQIQGKVPPWI